MKRVAAAAARQLAREGAQETIWGGSPPSGVSSAQLLRQCRLTQDQSGLSSRRRQENVAHSMRVHAGERKKLAGSNALVIVVDDVVTTGATLTEAARALSAAGAPAHGCAVISSTILRRQIKQSLPFSPTDD